MGKALLSRSYRLLIAKKIGAWGAFRRLLIYGEGLLNLIPYLCNKSNFYRKESKRKQLLRTVLTNTSVTMLLYGLEYFFSLPVHLFWGIDLSMSVSNILFLSLSLLVYIVFSYRYCGQFKDIPRMLIRELMRPFPTGWQRLNQFLSVCFSLFWSVSALFVFSSIYAIVISVMPPAFLLALHAYPFPVAAGGVCLAVGGVTVLGITVYWCIKFLVVFCIEQDSHFWFKPQWRLVENDKALWQSDVQNNGDFFHRFANVLVVFSAALRAQKHCWSGKGRVLSFTGSLTDWGPKITRCFSGKQGRAFYHLLDRFFQDFFPSLYYYQLQAKLQTDWMSFHHKVYQTQQRLLLDVYLHVWPSDQLLMHTSSRDLTKVKQAMNAAFIQHNGLMWVVQQNRRLLSSIFHAVPRVINMGQPLLDKYTGVLASLFFHCLLQRAVNDAVVAYVWDDVVHYVSANSVLVPDVLGVTKDFVLESEQAGASTSVRQHVH